MAVEPKRVGSTAGLSSATSAYVAKVVSLLGETDPLGVLTATPGLLAAAIRGRGAAALARPEAPGRWSAQIVLAHLADAELVWGVRVRLVLTHERPVLTGYDENAFAAGLGYDKQPAADSLRLFTVLRESNLSLLRRTDPADLRRTGLHSERGEESLGLMLKLFAGHDLVHLRQLERIAAAVG